MTLKREPRSLPLFDFSTSLPVQPVEWLVERFLARGAGTILFGQPGVSKTAHAAHLAACLVAGVPFAELPTIERGLRVLYLDFDGSIEWNMDLFKAAFRGIGREDLHSQLKCYSPNTEACILPGEDTLQSLEALGPDIACTVREHSIDLVICDSLGQMMMGDTNSGQDVALALRAGLNPARTAGAAVLVIDHATKAAATGNGVPTPIGSQQKRAWARVSVALESESYEDHVVTRWSVDKSNAAPFRPFRTRLDFQTAGGRLHQLTLTALGEAGARIRPDQKEGLDRTGQARQAILGALQSGARSRHELGSGSTVDRALKFLVESGQIQRLSHGLYGLSQSGNEVEPSGRPDIESQTW
ncbi:AAA family ATPase [Deinococcus radiotolerans]|uniref:AAA family ATPase n=1 Tax=Deinococcus radiotolerans TaxID=1309407 RepID=UPI00227D0598|nr:AAA family ATPase [Deinococcus radiotolerans]